MGTPSVVSPNGVSDVSYYDCGLPDLGPGVVKQKEIALKNFPVCVIPEVGDSSISNKCLEELSKVGGEPSLQPADSSLKVGADMETVKTTASHSSIFDKAAARQTWGASQIAVNVLRTVSTVLNEVDGIDGDVRLALNLVKVALGLILSSYDLANGVNVTEKFERNQEFYKNQFENTIEKAQAALKRAEALNRVEACDSEASTLDGTSTSPIPEETLLDEINGYVESREALEKLARYSRSEKSQELINKLGNAKDVMSLVSSLSNFFRSLQGWVPVLATGAGAAVAGTVAAGLTIGIGVVFSSYEIIQGCTATENAKQERSKFSELKAKVENAESFKDLSQGFKAGLSNFFSRKIENATVSLASAVSRIIRGVVGLVIGAVGIAALVASVGNAAFVAGVLGGISSALYFLGIMLRINRDVRQVEENKAERAAAEILKNEFNDIDIFLNLTRLDNSNDNDSDNVPTTSKLDEAYRNKYFMVWCLAKQFSNDCVDSVRDTGTGNKDQLESLLMSLGLTEEDINVMKLLPEGGTRNTAVIEKMIGLRIGI